MCVISAKTMIVFMSVNPSTAVGPGQMVTGPVSPTNFTKNLPSPTMYIMITEITWIENYPTTGWG